MAPEYKKTIIALAPEDWVFTEAIKESKQLAENFETEFELSDKGPFPHITLYYAMFTEAALKKIKPAITYGFRWRPTDLTFGNWSKTNNCVDIGVNLSPELKALHFEVLDAFNEFRDGHIRQRWIDDVNETEDLVEQGNLEKFGSKYVFDTYRPHLSLTKSVKDIPVEKLEILDKWRGVKFRVNKIKLFEAGDNGTCIREI